MKIGIIGLQGSGKTTIFETLIKEAGLDIKYGTYGEERLKPHIGTINIKDERLTKLAEAFKPKKTTYAELTFLDRPGFDLASAKETDAIIIVISMFLGRDPIKEINDVEAELIISDLGIVQNTLKRLEKESKGGGKKEEEIEKGLLIRANKLLENGVGLREMELLEQERKLLHGFQFLTQKAAVWVLNVQESELGKEAPPAVAELLNKKGLRFVEFCAEIELEIQELSREERPEYMKSLGIGRSARDKLVASLLETLKLVTFFTVKGDEARAWLVRRDTKVIDAAGKIHSDMARGFIRAEVVNYKELIDYGFSFQEAKKKGHHRLEGRDYIVKDGDVLDIRFSV